MHAAWYLLHGSLFLRLFHFPYHTSTLPRDLIFPTPAHLILHWRSCTLSLCERNPSVDILSSLQHKSTRAYVLLPFLPAEFWKFSDHMASQEHILRTSLVGLRLHAPNAWVQSLVRELDPACHMPSKSYMPQLKPGAAKQIIYKKEQTLQLHSASFPYSTPSSFS